MKIFRLLAISLLCSVIAGLSSCNDDNTTMGSVIAGGEVDISVETIPYKLNAQAVSIPDFDSKTGNLMIGSLQVDNYGSLDCAFVTRLMCSGNIEVPDSLFTPERVDSCKLIMGAERKEIVGDSLAPQRLSIYKLTKQLPSDINNNFNPDGYYNPSEIFASKSYTVSGIAEKDSAFYSNNYVDLTVDLPVEFGKEIFTKYKEDPSIFQWPQTMAEKFLPGLYIKQTFGNGCVANIKTIYIGVYYHSLKDVTTVDDEDNTTVTQVHVNHLAVPFTVSPEVLSSNIVSYLPSESIIQKNSMTDNDGEVVLTTPGGYIAQFEFPAKDLIDRYNQKNVHLSTVNDLYLYLPATSFDPESGIGVCQSVLLIKAAEYENFFKNNRVPDNMTAFTGVFDPTNERYTFTSMRNYFISLLNKDEITEDDVNFVVVPVDIETESFSGYYGENTYVTKCVPYTAKPTMTLLKTNEATVDFSFSTQIID